MGDVINSPQTVNTDFEEAAAIYAAQQEKFRLASLIYPTLNAAATAGLIALEQSERNENEREARAFYTSAQKELCACMEAIRGRLKDATDDVPRPAMYQPVHPAGEQIETIEDNIDMLFYTKEFAEIANRYHQEEDLKRLLRFNPDFAVMQNCTWTSIGHLLKGEVGTDQLIRLLSNDAEEGLFNGRQGATCKITNRNIGVLQYNIAAAARNERRLELQSDNQNISPLARTVDLRSLMLDPNQRIAFGIQQAQFIQNAAQNAFNACARKAPYLAEQLNLDLNKCLQNVQLESAKALTVNQFVPSYASLFNNQVRQITQQLGNGVLAGIGGIQSGISQANGFGNFDSNRGLDTGFSSFSNPSPTVTLSGK